MHVGGIIRMGLGFSLLAAGASVGCGPGGSDGFDQAESVPWTAEESGLVYRMLDAEDARPQGEEGLQPLLEGLLSSNAWIRGKAVRGIGRLEREDLLTRLGPVLDDPDPGVRAEAASAVARSGASGSPEAALELLLARAAVESEPGVRGALALALGSLPAADPGEAAARALHISRLAWNQGTGTAEAELSEARLTGLRGLFLLARRPESREAIPGEVLTRLREELRPSGPRETRAAEPDVVSRRLRSLSLATLVASAQASPDDLDLGLSDPDPLVRREAMLGADGQVELLRRGLADPAPVVRVEAVRRWSPAAPPDGCAPLIEAMDDPDPHVALTAMERSPDCPRTVPLVARLVNEVMRLPDRGAAGSPTSPVGVAWREGWHAPARALVALARIEPANAAARLGPFAENDNAFVRAYAARAAAAARQLPLLRRLAADDPNPNVRHAAVEGLLPLEGRGADSLLVGQLDRDDGQLLMATARGLQGTRHPEALPSLLDALDRISERRRETSRDPRMALLARIQELGGPAQAPRMTPYLEDFDPVVATRAAEILEGWTGRPPRPNPQPLPRRPVPPLDRLQELDGQRFRLEMERGGSFEIELLPWDAPTNAARFAGLAQAGWFDGLTLHRVVPNFVVQGGSPAANEYAGDGPFTRDEIARPHWRGTVGLSTRGRDTGDAQIFVNLVDNVRLDPDYTIFGIIRDEAGMAVVDAVLEGDRIVRVVAR